MIKTHLFALLCVFSLSLQLCTITSAQSGGFDLDLDLDFESCEWNEHEIENWENCENWENEEYSLGNGSFATPLTPAALVANDGGCAQQYTIVAGDICDNIASANGIQTPDLQNLNPGLDCNSLQVGAAICVKGGAAPPSGGCTQQYTIVSGDICDNIASANGIQTSDLQSLNPGLDCSNLQVGAAICVKGGSTPTPTPTPGSINISFDQFSAAVTATNGYPAPSQDQYNSFINHYTDGDISTPTELAMFLAEVIWETGGLQFKAELACKDTGCPDNYQNASLDVDGKDYYGRGYLQLTWAINYKDASEGLYQDDRLLTDPDQVATNEDVAWQSAFWYWKTYVHTDAGVQAGQFGSATNMINGQLECNPCQGNCPRRNEIYGAVLTAFGIGDAPNTAGC